MEQPYLAISHFDMWLSADVPQLMKYSVAFGMNSICYFFPACCLFVGINAWCAEISTAKNRNSCTFSNNQTFIGSPLRIQDSDKTWQTEEFLLITPVHLHRKSVWEYFLQELQKQRCRFAVDITCKIGNPPVINTDGHRMILPITIDQIGTYGTFGNIRPMITNKIRLYDVLFLFNFFDFKLSCVIRFFVVS